MSFIHNISANMYFAMLLFIALGLGLSLIVLLLSYTLTEAAPDTEKVSTYECGFEPFEDARNRFDVRFYIVAILFLIFDIEVAFLYPWAVSLSTTGAAAYGIVALFLVILTLGFLYEVSKGALETYVLPGKTD